MASVSTIGGSILVNQMTPAVASNQNAHTNRVDFQNMIAQSQVQEKDEKVLEVRPAEENQEVNEDKEHTRDEADRESERSEKPEDEEEDDNGLPQYKLNILV